MKIKIIKTPSAPSFAPEDIRKSWVGIVVPVEEDENPLGLSSGTENMGGYIVKTSEAIKTLRDAGKDQAAQYWQTVRGMLGKSLRFDRDCCEVLD